MSKIKIPWAVPEIKSEEFSQIRESFDNDWLTMGPKVKEFETRFANYMEVPYAIAVSNGTDALELSLKVLGIGPGDEVLIPSMTYIASASSVSNQYAVPVFVDISRENFNLDPEKISEAITEKTKAVVFIDYGGNPADYDEIKKAADQHGLRVIQDGAHSIGGNYKGKPLGCQSEISTTSFHMAKVMSTVEGGMIFTHNEEWKNEILVRRNQGESITSKAKYRHELLGTNARMTELQAGMGLAQMDKLPWMLAQRQRVAERYNAKFNAFSEQIETVRVSVPDCQNVWFHYPVLIDDRDRVAENLIEKHGIDTRICYPMPVYSQGLYASGKLNCRNHESPVAMEVTSRILDLPIFPSMTDGQVDQVADALISELTA